MRISTRHGSVRGQRPAKSLFLKKVFYIIFLISTIFRFSFGLGDRHKQTHTHVDRRPNIRKHLLTASGDGNLINFVIIYRSMFLSLLFYRRHNLKCCVNLISKQLIHPHELRSSYQYCNSPILYSLSHSHSLKPLKSVDGKNPQ